MTRSAVIGFTIAAVTFAYASYDRVMDKGMDAGAASAAFEDHTRQLETLTTTCEQMPVAYVPRLEADTRFGELRTQNADMKKTLDNIYEWVLAQ